MTYPKSEMRISLIWELSINQAPETKIACVTSLPGIGCRRHKDIKSFRLPGEVDEVNDYDTGDKTLFHRPDVSGSVTDQLSFIFKGYFSFSADDEGEMITGFERFRLFRINPQPSLKRHALRIVEFLFYQCDIVRQAWLASRPLRTRGANVDIKHVAVYLYGVLDGIL